MKNKNKIYAVILLLFFIIDKPLIANEVIDSLKNVLVKTEDLEERSELCKYIAERFYPINQDSILRYYALSQQYAKDTPSKKDDIEVIRGYGYYHTNLTNEYQEAINYYQEALQLSQQIDDARNVAMIKNDLGIVYWKKGAYKEAINAHFEANEIAQTLDDPDLSMRTLLSLGVIHNEGVRNEEAKDFYLQALPLAEQVGHQRAAAILLNNLGKVHRDLSKYDEAQTYFERALQAFEKQKDIYWQGLSHYNLGYNFFLQGQFKKAIDAYDKALLLNENTQDKDRTVMILTGLAETYEAARQDKKAIEHALQAFNILEDFDTKLYHTSLNTVLARSYERQKNYKKSSVYFQKNIEISNEGISSTNQKQELAKMKALYQNQRKAIEINQLQIQHKEEEIKQQRTFALLIGSIGLMALIMIIARLYFYRMKVRQMEKYNQLRSKLTNDLHDNIGSSLNQIKILANKLNQNQQKEVVQKTDTEVSKIKSISNDLISNMYDLIWSIDKEKEQLQHLLNHMRDHASNVFTPLDLPFRMNIKAEEKYNKYSIDAELKNNIYSIYKEAINNIVKHTHPEDVQISIDIVDNLLNLKIQNDKKKILENQFSNKKGLKSMAERAKNIGGLLTIDDKENLFVVTFQVQLI